MKNKLADLNNHLFAQLERLGDEEIQGDALSSEIERARAVSSVARAIIDNGSLALSAAKFQDDRLNAEGILPPMLGS